MRPNNVVKIAIKTPQCQKTKIKILDRNIFSKQRLKKLEKNTSHPGFYFHFLLNITLKKRGNKSTIKKIWEIKTQDALLWIDYNLFYLYDDIILFDTRPRDKGFIEKIWYTHTNHEEICSRDCTVTP